MQSTGGVGGVDRVVGSTKTLKLQLKTFKVECDFVPSGHLGWALGMHLLLPSNYCSSRLDKHLD